MSNDAVLHEFATALLADDAAALYDRAPCGYLSTAPDGTILKVNATFATLSGYDSSELVGRRFSDLLTGGGRIYHETHYAPMLRLVGAVHGIALDIVRADGERLPALVNSVLERDERDEPVVIRTAVFDATDRRAYEQELVRAKERAEASEARATLLAHTLQQTLVPPHPPDIPGLDVGAAFHPAGTGSEIGGDFYDVFERGPGDWVVSIGDVCGKGVDAAIVTTLVRHTIRAAAVRHPRPSSVLQVVNEVLLRDPTEKFCTAAVIRLTRTGERWTAVIAAAGHPLPLLRRAGMPSDPTDETATRPLEIGQHGPLLGIFEAAGFADDEVHLDPGDTVVLYTDGVTEGRRDGRFFGDERLHDSMTTGRLTAQSLADKVMSDVLDYQFGDPSDDVAVVTLSVP